MRIIHEGSEKETTPELRKGASWCSSLEHGELLSYAYDNMIDLVKRCTLHAESCHRRYLIRYCVTLVCTQHRIWALCGDPWTLALALGKEHGGKLGSFKEVPDYCLALAVGRYRNSYARACWRPRQHGEQSGKE